MIDLLSGLERSLSLTSDVSIKLRGHVAQIESYMAQSAKTAQQGQVFHSVIPQYTQKSITTTSAGPEQPYHGDILPTGGTSADEADLFSSDMDAWTNDFTFEWPSDHQTALQSDLTENWPFDFSSGIYDFLGQGSSAMQGESGGDGLPSSSTDLHTQVNGGALFGPSIGESRPDFI